MEAGVLFGPSRHHWHLHSLGACHDMLENIAAVQPHWFHQMSLGQIRRGIFLVNENRWICIKTSDWLWFSISVQAFLLTLMLFKYCFPKGRFYTSEEFAFSLEELLACLNKNQWELYWDVCSCNQIRERGKIHAAAHPSWYKYIQKRALNGYVGKGGDRKIILFVSIILHLHMQEVTSMLWNYSKLT